MGKQLTRRIRFTESRQVFATDPKTNAAVLIHDFKAGEAYDLIWPSAQRWLRRGVAVVVDDEVTAPAPETETVEDTGAPAPKPRRGRPRQAPAD